jgi:hypothetical protein
MIVSCCVMLLYDIVFALPRESQVVNDNQSVVRHYDATLAAILMMF